MPGRFEPFADFLRAAATAGATGIVCLAADAEIAALSPEYAVARRRGDLPLPVVGRPIPDFGAPDDRAAFADLVSGLCADLYRGGRLILHCAAGVGRTGLVAQQVLMAMGVDPGDARARVALAGSGPETRAQQAFCSAAVILCPRA
jgi:protein-tyrosine phosphatase